MPEINWEAVPKLGPLAFGVCCDHHAELQEARKLIEKREQEITDLTAELGRRFDLITAMLRQQGGRAVIRYEDFGSWKPDDLEIFGWMGDWLVIQDHAYRPEDAKDLPGDTGGTE